MSKIIWEKEENLFGVLQKIASQEEAILELFLPEERRDLNLLDLKIARSYAEGLGKHVTFKDSGEKTGNLVQALGQKTEVEIPAPQKKFISRRKIVAIPIILLSLLGLFGLGAYGALIYLPKAEVDLKINPVPLVKTFDAFADSAISEINFEQNLLPGKWVEITKSGEKSTATTGTATVGEESKGEITLLNCDDANPITFPVGTVLKVEGTSLNYTLDSAVTDVPARVGATCGTKAGNITAAKIGAEYNQDVGVEFDYVGGYDNTLYDAYVASGQSVSGGSSQPVKVVTSADKNSLLDQAKIDLKNQATQEFKDRKDVILEATALLEEVLNQTFSADVGQEAENLSLSITIKYKTLGFSQENFEGLGREVLKKAIPEGFEIFPEDPEFGVVGASFEGESRLKVLGKVSALVVNVIKKEEIKGSLSGRTSEEASAYLSGLENIESFEIRLWPKVPILIKTLPRNPNRIIINLLKD